MLRLHDVRSIRVAWILTGTAALALTGSCGGGSSSPSAPPTAVATPTPAPTATPTSPASICSPTPPPLYGIRVKVHDPGDGFRRILDSRPLVVNMNGFCESAVGLSGDFCVTRREGDAQAWACDYLAMGHAADTGRWGPTWYGNGLPCTSAGDSTPGCRNDSTNQFLLVAKGPGTYAACANADAPVAGDRCGELVIQ